MKNQTGRCIGQAVGADKFCMVKEQVRTGSYRELLIHKKCDTSVQRLHTKDKLSGMRITCDHRCLICRNAAEHTFKFSLNHSQRCKDMIQRCKDMIQRCLDVQWRFATLNDAIRYRGNAVGRSLQTLVLSLVYNIHPVRNEVFPNQIFPQFHVWLIL